MHTCCQELANHVVWHTTLPSCNSKYRDASLKRNGEVHLPVCECSNLRWTPRDASDHRTGGLRMTV